MYELCLRGRQIGRAPNADAMHEMSLDYALPMMRCEVECDDDVSRIRAFDPESILAGEPSRKLQELIAALQPGLLVDVLDVLDPGAGFNGRGLHIRLNRTTLTEWRIPEPYQWKRFPPRRALTDTEIDAVQNCAVASALAEVGRSTRQWHLVYSIVHGVRQSPKAATRAEDLNEIIQQHERTGTMYEVSRGVGETCDDSEFH